MQLRLPGAFGLLMLFASAATAQEVRTPCQAGATTFPIQYGAYIECSMTASSTHVFQVDAVANEFFGLHLVLLAGTGDPCVTVENPAGVVVMTRVCSSNIAVPGTRDAVQAIASGKYRILVTELGTTFQTFQYSLNVERMAPPTANAPLLFPDQFLKGSINPRGDRDMVRFGVKAGDRFAFFLRRTAGSGDGALQIIDGLGAVRTLFSGVTQVAASTGTFAVWVRDVSDNQVLEFELDFVCAGDGTPGSCPRPPPEVKAVVNAANTNAPVCSGAFAAVFGDWFSPSITRTWEGRDFVGLAMPKALEGVSAKLAEKNSSVSFVSRYQMNIITPNLPPGQTDLRVITSVGQSDPFKVTVAEFCPAAFMIDQRFAIAVYADRSLSRTPSTAGRASKPGDLVSLYVTGLGPTSPAYREGEIPPGPLPTANPVRVFIGNVQAEVSFAGLTTPGGLYQINLKIPVVPVGEQPLRIEVGQAKSPDGVSFLISAQ